MMVVGNDSMGYHYYSFASGSGESGSGSLGSGGSSPGGSNSGSGLSSTTETLFSATLQGLLNYSELARYWHDIKMETMLLNIYNLSPIANKIYQHFCMLKEIQMMLILGKNCLDYVKGVLD